MTRDDGPAFRGSPPLVEPSRAPSRDAELVQALATGDKRALAELYDRHAATALGLALRILRDARDAEDIVHDVFLELWRRAATYRSDMASVRTWLLLMVRSRCFDRRSSAARRLTVPLGEDVIHAASSDDTAPDRARVGALLDRLPKSQREAIFLGYFEGLSSTEIAARLDAPVGTVKSRVAAALATLRDALGAPAAASPRFPGERIP